MITVRLKDGCCKSCKGQLIIIDVDDSLMEVQCTECEDTYEVESDAFHDGGIDYWPRAMVAKEEGTLGDPDYESD